MNELGLYVIEQTLIMGNYDCGIVFGLELVHSFGHYAESIDIKAGVSLVKDGETRLEHSHLENLVAFLLAS